MTSASNLCFDSLPIVLHYLKPDSEYKISLKYNVRRQRSNTMLDNETEVDTLILDVQTKKRESYFFGIYCTTHI